MIGPETNYPKLSPNLAFWATNGELVYGLGLEKGSVGQQMQQKTK